MEIIIKNILRTNQTMAKLNLSKIENFNYSWHNWYDLIKFPMINVSNGKTFNNSWSWCYWLNNFPKLDMSNGYSFNRSWDMCRSLMVFPEINFNSGIYFKATWHECGNLKEFPLLNVPRAKSFEHCWARCYKLRHFPPNMFDNLSGDIDERCFYGTWDVCDLTAQSVENILVSINNSKITIDNVSRIVTIGMNIRATLTEKTMNAVEELKIKRFRIVINNKKI